MSVNDDIRPQNTQEKVLWHCIVWTYGYYLLGALYVLAPVVGWVLLVRQARVQGLREVPVSIWVWVVGMVFMLLALLAAHADYDLGAGLTLKSSIGWAKGWALVAVFTMLGCSAVRLELLARAACLLGIQTLCVLPPMVLSYYAGLPGQLYVSPVSMVGGPSPEFFAVELYGLTPEGIGARWRLFTPWAPAIGMVMCMYFLLALNERNRRLRLLGMAGMLLAVMLSQSRLALMVLPAICGLTWLLRNLNNPRMYLFAAPVPIMVAVAYDALMELVDQATSRFHGARADSSRVRAALGRIALHRWQTEAYLWGHGTVERGPHLVEFMPIGTHHTWFGLLFVKGIVGACALAGPMVWSAMSLLRSGLRTPATLTAMNMLLLLFFYTFAENLEILAYLFWPGLVAMGSGLREAAKRAAVSADPPVVQSVPPAQSGAGQPA